MSEIVSQSEIKRIATLSPEKAAAELAKLRARLTAAEDALKATSLDNETWRARANLATRVLQQIERECDGRAGCLAFDALKELKELT